MMNGIFSRAKSVDVAFRQVKHFALIVVLASLFLCGFIVVRTQTRITEAENKVLVLLNGKVVEAVPSTREENKPVEARDHVATFHEYFFTLSPDDRLIQENINRALYLADRSAKDQYDNLVERNYFSNVISGNVSQRIRIDSVVLDMERYPYYFRCMARQEITRVTAVVERSLITEGYLRSVPRSEQNSHGLLIERWKILENNDITVKPR
ncbi:conjugative transposon protein TraK [Chitinophaga horti]|uniref:Conjugative transposon protein TraK n=1 Tax=Chitinophaga horti TaxID=2920382 RepID=A0ABY6IXN7_9BACT|nr:conjugative transposon protein TraK [Chitinophaga horti]UYQ92151.1 conjugative transposon protein TraK [Chitinophaga horti]